MNEFSHSNHYAIFKKLEFIKDEQWAGFNLRKWSNYVFDNTDISLKNDKVSRLELKNICSKDSGYSNKDVVASVMAWGGQNRKHGKLLFKRFDEIDSIISGLRNATIDHLEAYRQFDAVWKEKDKLLGMGAAYFTKLIFFCHKEHKGYIMDQWTSKSANMLSGERIVHVSKYGYVTKENDVSNYKQFCCLIDSVASDLSLWSEQVEIMMFSKGGRNKDKWRQYVCDNWENISH